MMLELPAASGHAEKRWVSQELNPSYGLIATFPAPHNLNSDVMSIIRRF